MAELRSAVIEAIFPQADQSARSHDFAAEDSNGLDPISQCHEGQEFAQTQPFELPKQGTREGPAVEIDLVVCDARYLIRLGCCIVGLREGRRGVDFGVGFLGLVQVLGRGAQVDDAGDAEL